MYKDFDDLKAATLKRGRPLRCGVVMPRDAHTMEAVNLAADEGFIIPVLIDADDSETAMSTAVGMVHAGEIEMLMKGMLQTADFMRAIVKSENNLRTGSLISMLSFREVPNYHKLLAFTDTGICVRPDLMQKIELIRNAAEAMDRMGFEGIKVAVLSSAETPNPKMPESMDGVELKEMNLRGEIKGCVVDGPLSIDLALSKEAADTKGYVSPVSGDADLLLFPDLASANITAKMIGLITGKPAGVMILGTRLPVVVCSRSATTQTKLLCLMLASANSRKE